MQVGIHFINFDFPGGPPAIAPTLAATARAAEAAGCSTFTLMDHWFQMEGFGGPPDPMLEGYTALGYLAGQTQRLTLGLMVTGVTYRHPGLLAKIATTLDVLSGGRALLGIGAAWYQREHEGLGVPFPPVRERFARLEEAIQICLQMWSENNGPYNGTYYQLAETICVPPPIQQPRPRLLIGGSGERKTLRLVARYADANNLFGSSPEVIQHKLEVLAEHCRAEGRDPATIQNTMLGTFDPIGDPDGFIAGMETYARLGIDMVSLIPSGPDPAAYVEKLGERVIPRLAQLEPVRR